MAGNIILSAVCFICRCPSTFLIDKSSILHNSRVLESIQIIEIPLRHISTNKMQRDYRLTCVTVFFFLFSARLTLLELPFGQWGCRGWSDSMAVQEKSDNTVSHLLE